MAPVPPLRGGAAGGHGLSQQINLLDARLRREKRHFAARTMVLAMAAVLALSLAIQQLYAFQNRALERALAQTDARVAQSREQVVRFAREYTAKGASAALNDEVVRLESELRLQQGMLGALQTGAGDGAGFSPYLAALARQTMNGVWLTGVGIGSSPAPASVVLTGRALDGDLVPAYIRRLSREETFAGRSVSELRLSAKPENTLEFSLRIALAKEPS